MFIWKYQLHTKCIKRYLYNISMFLCYVTVYKNIYTMSNDISGKLGNNQIHYLQTQDVKLKHKYV